MTRSLEFAAGLLALAVISAAAQDKPTTPLRKFTTLQVEDVRVAPTVTSQIPPEYIRLLRESILHNVKNRHKFHQVGDVQDPKAAEPEKERILLLRVEIVAFQPASRSGKLLLGPALTRDKIRAHCQFVEGSTGAVVWDLAVEGGSAFKASSTYDTPGYRTGGIVYVPPWVTGDFTKQFAKLIEQNW